MTTISGFSSSFMLQRPANPAKPGADGDFAAQYEAVADQSDDSHADRIDQLQTELDALQDRQFSMSNRDYILAQFTLLDQLATERLQAGEDIETLGFRFEGQIFNIAGKIMKVDLSQSIDRGIEMVELSRPIGSSLD